MQRLIAALLTAVVVLLGALLYQGRATTAAPVFTTPYQAVVLTSGQVYYGKLENASGLYPVLRDVFYVSSQTNTATRETSNVLVRRGKELHGPDYMVLNRLSILFVEPVNQDSQVARFITEQAAHSN